MEYLEFANELMFNCLEISPSKFLLAFAIWYRKNSDKTELILREIEQPINDSFDLITIRSAIEKDTISRQILFKERIIKSLNKAISKY